MATADVDPSTAYVPPEFIRLTAAVAANGLDAMRDRAAAGMEQVYGLDPVTGSMLKVPQDFWRSAAARGVAARHHSPTNSPSGPVETLVAVVSATAIAPLSARSPRKAADPCRQPAARGDLCPAAHIRRVTDAVTAERSRTRARRLARGGAAFGITPITGERVQIPLDVWWSQDASRMLATGVWTRTLPHHGNRRPTEDLSVVLPVRSAPPHEDNPPSLPSTRCPRTPRRRLPSARCPTTPRRHPTVSSAARGRSTGPSRRQSA